MSTNARVGSAIPGKRASIVTVRQHAPELTGVFDDMYATLLGGGVVGMDVKEAMRLRNAQVSDCGL
jgi:hypothetical protein